MDSTPNTDVLDEILGLTKEAVKATKDELRSTQKKEIDLWHNWNNNGRKPKDLAPLLNSFRPVLERHAAGYTRGSLELPSSAIHTEFKKQFVLAVKTYNPDRGTQLGSWVQTNLKKAGRFVKTYQNFGKIPEQQISRIRPFNQALEELTIKNGYEPDAATIADHLSWPKKKVVQLMKEMRADKPLSGYKGADPAEILAPKESEAVRLMQYGLPAEHRLVYEYTFGVNGKPELKPGEIAKKTGIHPSKISRIRNSLQQKLQEAMDVL